MEERELNIEKAERLKRLPPYLFKEIDRQKEEVRAKGVDIIDLGRGRSGHTNAAPYY